MTATLNKRQCGCLLAALLLLPVRLHAADDTYQAAYTNEVYGKYADAISGYQAVLKDASLEALWPKTMFRLGATYRAAEKNKESATTLESIAAKYPDDERAPKALWFAMTAYSGPLNDGASALRVAQLLHRQYAKHEYGQRAAYGEVFLHYVSNDKPRTREACLRYLEEYPEGTYREATNQMLKRLEAQP